MIRPSAILATSNTVLGRVTLACRLFGVQSTNKTKELKLLRKEVAVGTFKERSPQIMLSWNNYSRDTRLKYIKHGKT